MAKLDRRLRRMLTDAETALNQMSPEEVCKDACRQLAVEIFWLVEHANETRWCDAALPILQKLADLDDYDDMNVLRPIVLEEFYGPLWVFASHRRPALIEWLKIDALQQCQAVIEVCMELLGLDTPPQTKRPDLKVYTSDAIPPQRRKRGKLSCLKLVGT